MQLLLWCFTLLSFPSFSQSYPISGKVTDENNTPLKNIEVHLKNQKDSLTAVTGRNGTFTTKPLPRGIYYLAISAHGYEEYRYTIDNTN